VKTFPDEANGKFAHIMDPDGNKIELWQPKPMG
jgi:predicted enzyme related to lactoylglutathione lyase